MLHSTVKITNKVIEVSNSGDLAYTRGTQRLDYITLDGTVEEVSKWIAIWKKIDGEWKAIVVIGNQDNP